MDATRRWAGLLGLGGETATALDPVRVLAEAVPLLLEATSAEAVLVVRRDGDLEFSHVSGADLDTAEVPATLDPQGAPDTLAPVAVPPAWADAGLGHVSWQLLPGRLGALVLAGPAEPDEDDTIAAALVARTLGTLQARADLLDLESRIDNAQALANMGDYDWHIPSDTNRWSDQLYRIYGHEPQAFNPSYERFLGLIHPDDRERITEVHQHAYATGEPYQMLERIVRPDGEVRILSSTGEVILDADGSPVRMRGTCIDVTERLSAEREREQAAARLRGLVESAPEAILVVDHDEIVLEANSRSHDLLGGDPVGRRIGELLPDSWRESALAVPAIGLDGREHTLDISRSVVRLDGEELTSLFLRDAGERLDGEALAARLAQAQLRRRQALEINDNVVQGLVAAAYALDGEQYLSVAGYIEQTLTSARAMMDDLLEPLVGEDLSPGDLVRSVAANLGVPDSPREVERTEPSADSTVLIVDDAEDLRLLLRTRLQRMEGVTVVGEAADGLMAIEQARELQPDLVMLDLAMPRMDGLEALPHIRACVPDVRIIVFSGFNQNTLAERAMAAGADRYIVKGGSISDLVDTVRSLLPL